MKLKKLILIRKDNNLTCQDMATKLRVCKAYYSQIENGNRRLYYDFAKEIADIFKLKPDDLFYSKKIKYKKRK